MSALDDYPGPRNEWAWAAPTRHVPLALSEAHNGKRATAGTLIRPVVVWRVSCTRLAPEDDTGSSQEL